MDPGEYGTQGIDVARQPYGLALSPDRRYLWTPCAASGHVSIVDLATDRLAKNISLVNGVSEVAFDPAGRFAYVTNRKFDMISLLDAASGNFLLSFGQGDAIDLTGYDYREMAFTPDGRYLFVAAREPSGLLKIDTSLLPGYPNLAIERVLPMDTGPMSVTVTPDGKEAWVGTYDAHMVIALDVETGASLGSMKSGNGTTDIEIFARPERPDYYYALSVNFASHNLTLFDAMTKEVIWNLP
jgi:DNA-binding beta-propeller fold protein YncE